MALCSSIQVTDLEVRVANTVLLRHISCAFNSGNIYAILGQNGAGKSTLLKCLSHEILPSKGTVTWNNRLLNQFSYRELAHQRAVLSQSSELAFSFTVEALVQLGEEVVQRLYKEAIQVINIVLKVCDLESLRHRDYLTLSGGEQKRAQLARVLAQIWPNDDKKEGGVNFLGKWLFLDEWTAGLDIKHQQSLARYFKQWAEQGLGIIMVLHDVSFAAQLADRCLMLKGGKVFAEGDVNQVLTQPILTEALEMQVQVAYDAQTERPIVYPRFSL
ncbi:MAG: heme ABC transporter ATP-binding protein [Thiomicrorhabdus sp.]|nr:heme ABC transporter ATP-binding protein [Thiomicrorhabdus sp.]